MATEIPPQVRDLLKKADLLPPTAIRIAATLRIADHIADGVRDAAGIAERAGAQRVPMERLLRYLATIDVLCETDDGGYDVTGTGALLRSGAGLREALDIDGLMGRGESATPFLLHTLRTGKSAYAGVHGREYWEDVNAEPVFREQLKALGHSGLAWEGERIVKEYPWSGVGHVVDVGGNKGQLLVALLSEFSHLRGTLVELPNLVELATEEFARAGLQDRCTAVVGDFFAELPAGADVYVLSGVLADWDDEDAVRILRRCAEACGTRGRILLADIDLVLDMPDPADQAAAELRTMATVPGIGRDVDGVKELAGRAGLDITWEGEASAIRSLLELTPRTGTAQAAPDGGA